MASFTTPGNAEVIPEPVPVTHRISRIAHRAGNDRTILQQAIDAGVDWIEIDLWYSLGHLVARHERGLGRLPLVFDEWRVRYLRESLLGLEEIVRLTDGGPGLFIDLKGTSRHLPREIVNLLRRYGALDRAAVCGQHWPPLDAIARAEPRIKIFHSIGRLEHIYAFHGRCASDPPSAGVSIAGGLLTPELVQRLDRRGLQVFAWTINDPVFAQQLASWGVHGIISDRLDVLANLP